MAIVRGSTGYNAMTKILVPFCRFAVAFGIPTGEGVAKIKLGIYLCGADVHGATARHVPKGAKILS
jgi:hypothetical protein